METQLIHLEQYKMLRDEIMQNLREIRRTEFLAVVGIGATYAWLLQYKQDVSTRAIWFVAPCIVFLCACRCLFLQHHTKFIAGYLQRIEAEVFKNDKKLPGWERYINQYKSQNGLKSYLRTSEIGTICVWGIAFIILIVLSYLLSR